MLGSAAKGTMYAVIGKTGSWYKTYYRNKIAYIYTEYASIFTLKKAENENVEKVVEEECPNEKAALLALAKEMLR